MNAQISDKALELLHKFCSDDIMSADFQNLWLHAISDVQLKHLLEAEWEEFEDHSPLAEKMLYEGMHICSEEVKPHFILKRYWI